MELLKIPSLAGIVLSALIIYKLILYPLFFSPLSNIPAAHVTAPISSLWLHYIRFMQRENVTIYELHKHKGAILRTAPNELSVNCYEGGLKTIYVGGFDKHDFYPGRFNSYSISPMFAMLKTKPHSMRKRMLSHVYSKTYLFVSPTLRSNLDTVLFDRFLPAVDKVSMTQVPVEMMSLIYAYAMDSFTVFQFGLKLGSNFLNDEQQRQWYYERHSLGLAGTWTFWNDNYPRLVAFMHNLGLRLYPSEINTKFHDLEGWNLELCDQAETLLSTKPDLPVEDIPIVYSELRTAMTKSKEPSAIATPQPYPYRLDIASEMFDHNLAAVDTMPRALTWLFYEVSQRPALQTQLRDELLTLSPPLLYPRAAGHDGKTADPKDIDGLPLLDAVLQETLRRWSPSGGPQPRMTPSGGCTLAGYPNVPADVRVQSYAYTLHRNADVFPNPEEWKPERWLTSDPKQLVEMKRWFWSFGSGGRMCIGNHFAVNSMKHVVAALYTNFTSEIVSAPDMEQMDGFTGGPKGNKLVLRWKHV